MFNVCSSKENYLSARCDSADNLCGDIVIFGKKLFLLIIFCNVTFIVINIFFVLYIY
jgi:hypothetical protein